MIGKAFDDEGNALDKAYDQRIGKFLDEFEWYANALKIARGQEYLGNDAPTQQTLCRGAE